MPKLRKNADGHLVKNSLGRLVACDEVAISCNNTFPLEITLAGISKCEGCRLRPGLTPSSQSGINTFPVTGLNGTVSVDRWFAVGMTSSAEYPNPLCAFTGRDWQGAGDYPTVLQHSNTDDCSILSSSRILNNIVIFVDPAISRIVAIQLNAQVGNGSLFWWWTGTPAGTIAFGQPIPNLYTKCDDHHVNTIMGGTPSVTGPFVWGCGGTITINPG